MIRDCLTALLAAALLVPATASAQSEWERQVTSQLEQASALLRDEGFRLAQEAHTGTLDDGESETVTLTLRGGVDHMVLGVCDADCSDIDLRLYDEDGGEIDTDIQEDDKPIVAITPPATAKYRVRVIMVTCSVSPCFYGLGIFSNQSASEPSHGAQVHRGELAPGDAKLRSGEYADSYSFTARAGEQIVVEVASSEFDTYLIVKQPNGEQNDNDDYEGSSGRSRIDMVASESGQWRALVTSYSVGETGSYELQIRVGGGGQGGARFESGRLENGDQTLSTGEYADVYTFQGRPAEQAVIDLRSNDFDPYLILRAPGGDQTDNDDHEGDSHRSLIATELREDGRYTITVTSYRPGETGTCDLRIDQRGSAGSEGAGVRSERGRLASDDRTLRTGEYVDVYQFQGRPGQRVRLDLNSDQFDTYLILKDPEGEQTENDDADRPGHSVIETDLTEAGAYRVLVTSYAVGETGMYLLDIDLGTSTARREQRDVSALAIGRPTTGRLEPGDGQIGSGEYRDLYVFDGQEGHTVILEMTSSDFDTYVGLITPGGEVIENDDHEGSTSRSRIELTLPESGRYRIVATSYAGEQSGSYELHLRSRPAGPGARALARASGRIYGVFAGISDYGGRASDLAYTADDAVRVRDALVQGAGMRPDDGVLLTDRDVTIASVRDAIQSLARRVGPDDTFVFFYSGHGSRVPRGGPQPSDPDAMDETIELYDAGITDDEMRDLLAQIDADKIILLLDACFSGGFSKDVISVPGRMGLFSSEEDVTSSVAAKFRAGGYLAVFLADGVGNHLADADEDGQITAIELSQYVHERYRSDLKGGGPDDFVRTGGPQLGYQHLVVDRGSIGPYDVLFRR